MIRLTALLLMVLTGCSRFSVDEASSSLGYDQEGVQSASPLTSSFDLSFHCTQKGFCREFSSVDTSNPYIRYNSYAYAPSIIRTSNNVLHAWYCSLGVGQSGDAVRHVVSYDNGRSWNFRNIAVRAKFTNKLRDRDACDPSMVKFGDYYYLFYTSAERGNFDVTQRMYTVIQVARSKDLNVEFETLTDANTWEVFPSNPKAIIRPMRMTNHPNERYGAGQPNAIVLYGQIFLFYYDDTVPDDLHSIGPNTFLKISSDPGSWEGAYQSQIMSSADEKGQSHKIAFPSPDIKFDKATNQFVSLWTPNHYRCSKIMGSTSYDGISWSAPKELLPPGEVPRYSHNLGMESDPFGHIDSLKTKPLIMVSAHDNTPATKNCSAPSEGEVKQLRYYHWGDGSEQQTVMVSESEGEVLTDYGWWFFGIVGDFILFDQQISDQIIQVYNYSHPSGDHIYTTFTSFPEEFGPGPYRDGDIYSRLTDHGFVGGPSGLYLFKKGIVGKTIPIIRLRHPVTGKHRYVSSFLWADMFKAHGYTVERVLGHAYAPIDEPQRGYWQPFQTRVDLSGLTIKYQ